MKIKSTLLALLTGAALVAGACGGSTASPSASATAGTVCEKAIAAGEPETSLLGLVCGAGIIKIATQHIHHIPPSTHRVNTSDLTPILLARSRSASESKLNGSHLIGPQLPPATGPADGTSQSAQ